MILEGGPVLGLWGLRGGSGLWSELGFDGFER